MGDNLAAANVNRAYSLAGTTTAIFTFSLFFMYPRFASGQANGLLFQVTLVVLGVATFVFASLYYYCASTGGPIAEAEWSRYSRCGDGFWLLGYTLLFLDPSLILVAIGLLSVAFAWLALWLVYVFFVMRHFPR